MYTKLFFSLIALVSFITVHAQNFDKPKVKAKSQTYNVKTFTKNVFLVNEKNQYKVPNYRVDTLNLSGLAWKKAQKEATEKIKRYLADQRKISLESLPNIGMDWIILNTGQIKEVTFMFPKNLPLTVQDFEEMEKIITQTKIEVTKPQLYKSVNFIPLHIPFIWNKPVR